MIAGTFRSSTRQTEREREGKEVRMVSQEDIQGIYLSFRVSKKEDNTIEQQQKFIFTVPVCIHLFTFFCPAVSWCYSVGPIPKGSSGYIYIILKGIPSWLVKVIYSSLGYNEFANNGALSCSTTSNKLKTQCLFRLVNFLIFQCTVYSWKLVINSRLHTHTQTQEGRERERLQIHTEDKRHCPCANTPIQYTHTHIDTNIDREKERKCPWSFTLTRTLTLTHLFSCGFPRSFWAVLPYFGPRSGTVQCLPLWQM